MPGKEQKKMRLTDDGEIVDLNTLLQEDNETEDSHETQAQPIYCTNCGAGNLSDAKYCRSCGKALALQEMKTPPPPPARPRMTPPAPRMAMDAMEPLSGIKRKNEDFYESQMMMQGRPGVAWASALRFWTMLMMGGVIVCSFVFEYSRHTAWAIIPTLIAWFLVESVRGDKAHQLNFTSFWSEAITAGVMAAAAVLAFVFNVSWAIIPIMIAWFLVTAVRGDSLGK